MHAFVERRDSIGHEILVRLVSFHSQKYDERTLSGSNVKAMPCLNHGLRVI